MAGNRQGRSCVIRDFGNSMGVEEVILFPSSLHEIILLPKHKGQELAAAMCSRIVREINAAAILPGDVLGDRAYIQQKEQSNQNF